jgi:hypothetical protein
MNNIKDNIQTILSAVEDRIVKASAKTLDNAVERGMYHSGIAVKNYLEEGLKALQAETLQALSTINTQKPGIAEWDVIKNIIKQFVDSQYESLRKRAQSRSGWEGYLIIIDEILSDIGNVKEEIIAQSEMFIKGQQRELSEKEKIKRFEWLKIAVSFVAGILATIITQYLFK